MFSTTLLRNLPEYYRHFKALWRQASYPVTQEGMVYHCPLTLSRRHNLAVQQMNKRFLETEELSLPHILHVGVTSICNLRCPACPTGTHALGRPGEHLDFDVYARVVEEFRGSLLFMLFWDWGEPLLHPRLPDMIALARKYRIRTVVSTNASVTNTPERIERLAVAAPDVVIVCVDGATQETYEKYRVGGDLATVLDAARRIARVRERTGSPYPVLEFRTLATRYNESEMPDLLRMAEETGADVFSVKTLRPYDYRGHDIDGEMAPLSPGLARYAYDHAAKRIRPTGELRCGKPLYAPTLNSNGDLVFCSYAGHEEESFGSMAGASVRALWRSDDARRKRLRYLKDGGTRACQTCYFRSDHKPTMLFTVPLRPLPTDLSLVRATSPEDFLATVDVALARRWKAIDRSAA
jgi:MoaA/NifB/PqqE/SkfB family radical SAM enzyme